MPHAAQLASAPAIQGLVPSVEQQSRQGLEQAFSQFSQMSSQLTDSYSLLEARVSELKGELANLVERMAIMYPYGVIGVVELPKKFRYVDDEDEQLVDSLRSDLEERVAINGHTPDFGATAMLPPEGLDLKDYLGSLEQGLIQQALDDANGIVARAAERLRIRRTTLVRRCASTA